MCKRCQRCLSKKKVPYGLFMPPEMLIWLSLLFNQKPLGPNDLSQKKKLRSILENSIFSEKPLNSSHLLSKSFNLKILVEIPRLIKMIQQEQDSVTMDKGCRSYWERKNQSQTFTTFFFYYQGTLPGGLDGDQWYLLPDRSRNKGIPVPKLLEHGRSLIVIH